MPRCVLDASVTLAWLFNAGGRGLSLDRQIESLGLVAPWLWRLEVVNVVLLRERRGQLSEAQSSRLLQCLEALEVEIIGEPGTRSLNGLAQTARPHLLTAYDAIYLDLAIALALPLLTDDEALRRAAGTVGVVLIEPAKP